MNQSSIRNFCIIAHIDHGKSTLADRFLEETKTLSKKDMQNQVLDSMDLERERGITIKSHPIQIQYNHHDGRLYTLNLIDTPGHVDFSYEVSRSLAACEGALLVVDAAQGVEAQTVSNTYLAIENNLQIIPIINKVDLPSAQIEDVTKQIIELIGCDKDEIILASAKNGLGVGNIFDAIVNRIPPPKENIEASTRALIFDSTYDNYRGAIPYVRVVDGVLKAGATARFFGEKYEYEITEVGHFVMKMIKSDELRSGDVGYVIANIRDVSHILPGDTLTTKHNQSEKPLPGFKHIKPMVFSGLYPSDSDNYNQLRSALDKLKLNDASQKLKARIIEGWNCTPDAWPEYTGINASEHEMILSLVGLNDPWFSYSDYKKGCGPLLNKKNGSIGIVYKTGRLQYEHSLLDYKKVKQDLLKFLNTIQNKKEQENESQIIMFPACPSAFYVLHDAPSSRKHITTPGIKHSRN